MNVKILSFGFKNGIPPEADLVLDVRFMPNPYYEPQLRPLDGRDPAVSAFVLDRPEARAFLDQTLGYLGFLVPWHESGGRLQLTVALGCTGGRHRSVAVAEALHRRLLGEGWKAHLSHRDLS
ncbi:MAG: hypothetical protein JRJ35_08755 [Deltaproteobacteria bacterium]|nr:hypothetical protein [Deltaproteobacteria bacterium]MBW1950915.1 hypothetical protein [Deltaproteobacteria bacterium]RLB34287.1 MAG: hypothetical protein DRH20_12270 [Deltaproteobacteria bacterium]